MRVHGETEGDFSKSFKGFSAVVTGGSSGIGDAACLLLAEMGAEVFNLDIEPTSAKAIPIRCDVRELDSLVAAADEVQKFTEKSRCPLKFLFANAGVHSIGDVLDADLAEVEETISVNLRGTFHTLRAFLPILQDNQGSIVVNASDQALIGKPTSAAYGATKAAIAQLTKSQALRFAERGVRINAVLPAGVDTPMEKQWAPRFAKKYGKTAQHWAKISREASPLGRLLSPDEVARVAVFLLSDWASGVNGALWTIDGGLTAG